MWLDRKVSLYSSHFDNIGRPATFRQILNTEFARDLKILQALKKLDIEATDFRIKKKRLKDKLQCYTPAALLATKETKHVTEIQRSGVMQLDFDYNNIYEYNLEELKHCVFNLPFVGFCGLSCSGNGFYALVLIAEPDRLSEYAEHCFEVFETYGIKADTSKGKKVENLRYLSYDSNMLIRESPEVLNIKKFFKKPEPKRDRPKLYKPNPYSNNCELEEKIKRMLKKMVEKVSSAPIGTRFPTVQHAAFTLGGIGINSLLDNLIQAIYSSSQYSGEEEKYCKCARDCFKNGMTKPLQLSGTVQQDFET